MTDLVTFSHIDTNRFGLPIGRAMLHSPHQLPCCAMRPCLVA